jgi:RHS repeat-associated protein
MSTFMRKIRGKLLVLGGGLLLLVSINVMAQVTYVYTDPQGTPLAEADVNGNITATFDYAPYGNQALGSPPNGPGYTGHVNDPDTGLVYMQARYYDPAVGRFLSVDPVAPMAGNAFNFNRYDYANNNPALNIDPDGRCTGSLISGSGGNCPGSTETTTQTTNAHSILSVNAVFSHSTSDNTGKATPSDFPKATRSALNKVLSSPVGAKIGRVAENSNEKINLILIPGSLDPQYRWSEQNNGIIYSLNAAKFINEHNENGELTGATLDVLLMHEMGHTPEAARAFGYPYSANFKWSNEFDVVRNVENPYRASIGLPARSSYGGVSVPTTTPLE